MVGQAHDASFLVIDTGGRTNVVVHRLEIVRRNGHELWILLPDRVTFGPGRPYTADLPHVEIHDGNVSRRHCAIAVGTDGVVLRDENTPGGQFVNGRRVAQRYRVVEGDLIDLGAGAVSVTIRRGRPRAEKTQP